MARLLIVGARTGSLGDMVGREASDRLQGFSKIMTAGVGGEDYRLDVRNSGSVHEVLSATEPDVVVCTVGVNQPASLTDTYLGLRMQEAFHVNVVGIMLLLQQFVTLREGEGSIRKAFVAISSNSARIPRSSSLAYCASKAALSMAIRVAARELAVAGNETVVWGYEPGLLAGTPMTHETERAFADSPLHRMKGIERTGLRVTDLARMIVDDVVAVPRGLNGVMIPYDAGEQ